MRRQSQVTRMSAAALCIAGAGSVFASGPATAATEPAKTSSTKEQSRGKGNPSGVVVRHTVPDKIALGESVTLRLQFSGVTAADGATVEVRDLAARATVATLKLAQGEEKTLELPYTGRSDGMQFIDVITTQAGRSTVQSVPLRVGTGQIKLKTEGQRSTTSSGEAVISLPAASPAPGASR